jgi:hypothetical protein
VADAIMLTDAAVLPAAPSCAHAAHCVDSSRDERGGYVARLARARARLADVPASRAFAVQCTPCEDGGTVGAQLERMLDDIVARGGEGLVLRRGSSRHASGYTRDFLKVKRRYDAEAVVRTWNVAAHGANHLHVSRNSASNRAPPSSPQAWQTSVRVPAVAEPSFLEVDRPQRSSRERRVRRHVEERGLHSNRPSRHVFVHRCTLSVVDVRGLPQRVVALPQ